MIRSFRIVAGIVILSTVIITSSCKNGDSNSRIQGSWKIDSATRNGRPTLTFESGYMRFWNKDSIETNFTGEIIKTNYKYSRKKILTGNVLPDLTVNKIENETLAIEFFLYDIHFYFLLTKS